MYACCFHGAVAVDPGSTVGVYLVSGLPTRSVNLALAARFERPNAGRWRTRRLRRHRPEAALHTWHGDTVPSRRDLQRLRGRVRLFLSPAPRWRRPGQYALQGRVTSTPSRRLGPGQPLSPPRWRPVPLPPRWRPRASLRLRRAPARAASSARASRAPARRSGPCQTTSKSRCCYSASGRTRVSIR